MGISESNYVIDACHERVESFVRVSHYLSACVFFYRFQRQNRRFCCGDGGSGVVGILPNILSKTLHPQMFGKRVYLLLHQTSQLRVVFKVQAPALLTYNRFASVLYFLGPNSAPFWWYVVEEVGFPVRPAELDEECAFLHEAVVFETSSVNSDEHVRTLHRCNLFAHL